GDLKTDEAAELHNHLTTCPACQGEYAALERLRKTLDKAPAPSVRVDLSKVYAEAASLQERRLRRWRRVALAGLATAAEVLLWFSLNPEVRVEAPHLVVRWGAPEAREAPAPQQLPPAVQPKEPPVAAVTADDLRLLRELIHALADNAESNGQK